MDTLFTIGYEGAHIDQFIATLHAAGVRQLADVRAVPISRKPGFSKTKLAARLQSEGIRYAPYVRLGDPKPGRDAARAGDFALFRRIYGAHIHTAPAQNALADLAAAARAVPTALMCFERAPETCHRTIAARAVAERTGAQIVNLFVEGGERHVRHTAKQPCLHPGEGATAA